CCTAGITNLLGAQTQHPGGLIQIAQPLALVGSRGNRWPSGTAGRKPRAMAINPAPTQSCSTAGIANLLRPKRSVQVG
ncbi:MAG: hypothetical protein ACOYOZ_14315, partial [Pirellula sp.]